MHKSLGKSYFSFLSVFPLSGVLLVPPAAPLAGGGLPPCLPPFTRLQDGVDPSSVQGGARSTVREELRRGGSVRTRMGAARPRAEVARPGSRRWPGAGGHGGHGPGAGGPRPSRRRRGRMWRGVGPTRGAGPAGGRGGHGPGAGGPRPGWRRSRRTGRRSWRTRRSGRNWTGASASASGSVLSAGGSARFRRPRASRLGTQGCGSRAGATCRGCGQARQPCGWLRRHAGCASAAHALKQRRFSP
jgi:hypothetical protein